MKSRNAMTSNATTVHHAVATSLAFAALATSGVAAAQDEQPSPNLPATTEETARDRGEGGAKVNADADAPPKSAWSFNFTPVLMMPEGDYRLGGGVDPELKYTLDRGGVRLSAGLRVGGYYAKNLFGITTMPTIRLTVPVGPVEPYVSFGIGYGWLPESEQSGIATMSRIGVVFRFSEKFALGVEGTVQRIERSDFAFPSFGSALSFNF